MKLKCLRDTRSPGSEVAEKDRRRAATFLRYPLFFSPVNAFVLLQMCRGSREKGNRGAFALPEPAHSPSPLKVKLRSVLPPYLQSFLFYRNNRELC